MLSEPQPISNFESSEAPIWLLPTIEETAANLSTRTPPNQKEIEQINLILEALADKQLAIEEAKNR